MCGLLLLLAILLSNASQAIPRTTSPLPYHSKGTKVIVVVANRLLLSDLNNPALPTISKMLRKGGVGLVSPNCAGPKSEFSVMLTANTGSPCRGGLWLKDFYNADETLPDATRAGDAFAVRTGRKALAGSAVLLDIGEGMRESAKYNPTPVKLGALGDALHAAGLKTGVVSDWQFTPDGTERTAGMLLTDSRGIVDYGSMLSASLIEIRCSLGGVLVPQPTAMKSADAIVLSFTASTILDESKSSMTDSAYAVQRTKMLEYLDGVLRDLMADRNVRIVLISFSPPKGPSWNQLTPMIVYPARQAGLLTSQTTRTPGIVAASDFSPTVLELFGLRPSQDMIGRPIGVKADSSALSKLTDMGTRVTANERVLTPLALSLAGIGAVAFTIAALIVAFGWKPTRRVIKLLKAGLVAGGCTFVALLLGVLAPAGAAGYVIGTVVSMLLLVGICLGLGSILKRGSKIHALPALLVFGITTVVILADALTGCYLCKWSGPSSYQITAMRFYGVGNEYAGVLISMAAMLALFLRDRKWLLPIIGVMTIVTLGAGSLGANYGATATAVVTFGLLWLAMSRKASFGGRHVALAFGLAIAAVVAFSVVDWMLAGAAGTHAARSTGLTEEFGPGYLIGVALRKVGFNLKTTFSVKGIGIFCAFVPFLTIWFWGVQSKVRSLFENDPRMMAGIKAVLAGSAAAYLLNDSGIVFAAIMIAMTVLVLLYSVLEEVVPCRES